MKEAFLVFAKYNEETNKTVAALLGKLSNEDREKNRKSYYGSLSSLYRHIMGGTFYFLGLLKDAVADNAEAQKALAPLAKVETIDGKLGEEQWKKVLSYTKIVDKALVDFAGALKEKDLEAEVKIEWYKGKPPAVPLWFMLQQHTVHNTHHRGQISQILNSMKVEHDFSGINVKFL
jgi:uncharacterized damage-inducible protein DinB